jgi:hypothetical protein
MIESHVFCILLISIINLRKTYNFTFKGEPAMKKSLFSGLAVFVLTACSMLFAQDNLAPSQDPPGGLDASDCPMFVTFGWDDNDYADPVSWMVEFMSGKVNPEGSGNEATFDGAPARHAFFFRSDKIQNAGAFMNNETIMNAYNEGHEIGNHTHNHEFAYIGDNAQPPNISGTRYSQADWENQMNTCDGYLSDAGIPLEEVYGFRSPGLSVSTETIDAMETIGHFTYDCSVEEGWQDEYDGTNFLWPYTLDDGSSGHEYLCSIGKKWRIGQHPGMWEIPSYVVILEDGSKQTGFDYNMWTWSAMSPDRFVEIMKANLDARYNGNRAPFFMGSHTNYYSPEPNDAHGPAPHYAEMRTAIEEFIDYALSLPDVRMVRGIDIINWMKSPVALGGTNAAFNKTASRANELALNSVTPSNITFSVPKTGVYKLGVFSMNGRNISSIADRKFNAGVNKVTWSGNNLSKGMYFVSIRGNNEKYSHRLVID